MRKYYLTLPDWASGGLFAAFLGLTVAWSVLLLGYPGQRMPLTPWEISSSSGTLPTIPPVAMSYDHKVPPYDVETAPHPSGFGELVIAVPRHLDELEKRLYRPLAIEATLDLEKLYALLPEYGFSMPSYFQDGGDGYWQMVARLTDEIADIRAEECKGELSLDCELATEVWIALEWEERDLISPSGELALTQTDSRRLVGFSLAQALPQYRYERDGDQFQPVELVAWHCGIWEQWSVLRREDSSPASFARDIPYSGTSKEQIVGHVWTWYLFLHEHKQAFFRELALGRIGSQAVVQAANRNPLSALAAELAFRYNSGTALSEVTIPDPIRQKVNEDLNTRYNLLPVVRWMNSMLYGAEEYTGRMVLLLPGIDMLDLAGVLGREL